MFYFLGIFFSFMYPGMLFAQNSPASSLSQYQTITGTYRVRGEERKEDEKKNLAPSSPYVLLGNVGGGFRDQIADEMRHFGRLGFNLAFPLPLFEGLAFQLGGNAALLENELSELLITIGVFDRSLQISDFPISFAILGDYFHTIHHTDLFQVRLIGESKISNLFSINIQSALPLNKDSRTTSKDIRFEDKGVFWVDAGVSSSYFEPWIFKANLGYLGGDIDGFRARAEILFRINRNFRLRLVGSSNFDKEHFMVGLYFEWSPQGEFRKNNPYEPYPVADRSTFIIQTKAPKDTFFGPLTVTGVTPATGRATGGDVVTVGGTGFQPGVRVFLGPDEVFVLESTSTSIDVVTSAHAPGTVDVMVLNPDSNTALQSNAFTYVP